MKILGTGLSGLVGSRITELLGSKYIFEDISLESGIDITDKKSVFAKIKNSDASIVLHLAAKTDVDGCEKDKPLEENGAVWRVNVLGTQNVVDACQESKKKLIYISTDFVFDGSKEFYSEDDTPNPVNWYAKTKYEGEKIVQNSSIPWIIARIAYPYRSSFQRLDFVRAILKRFQDKERVLGVTDHVFTPTFIDDVAYALDALIENNTTGIFHVVGSEFLSPYDAAAQIAKAFNFDENNITKTTRSEFFRNRAQRPFHLALKNDKIGRLGIKMRGFEEGLREVKTQMLSLSS